MAELILGSLLARSINGKVNAHQEKPHTPEKSYVGYFLKPDKTCDLSKNEN